MDFFSAQDNARKSTRWLILWFALAVIGIIVTVYLIFAFGMRYGNPRASWWNAELFLKTAGAVAALILVGSLYKISQLARGGGATVAAGLGGRLVVRNSADPLEQRLINVVEEMAIAAGIAVPPVYILDNESGINAFAAGNDIGSSVVAVTRGALQHLSRDELQAVIAHEFSHIFNGDMRLNMRLMGVLHGILLLTMAGRTMTRVRGRNAMQFALLGLVLILLGAIGVLFGKLIKAAVSRQREFLADASAVQFTRNPQALAGALLRIANAGAAIQHPNAEEASHMFFAKGVSLSSLLSTHPPLEERIKRIDRHARIKPSKQTAGTPSIPGNGRVSGFSAGTSNSDPSGNTFPVHTDISPAQVVYAQQLLEKLPPEISQAVHQLNGARAMLLGYFLSAEAETRQKQLADIQDRFDARTGADTLNYAQWLNREERALRLPVFDLAVATLKAAGKENCDLTMQTVDRLLGANSRLPLSHYIWRSLLRQMLYSELETPPRSPSIETLKNDIASLLSLLAFIGSDSDAERGQAYASAIREAPFDAPWPDYIAPQSLSLQSFDRILNTLAATRPDFRRKLVITCSAVVTHDDHVAPKEAELLRVICKSLNCPVPPLLQYATPLKT